MDACHARLYLFNSVLYKVWLYFIFNFLFLYIFCIVFVFSYFFVFFISFYFRFFFIFFMQGFLTNYVIIFMKLRRAVKIYTWNGNNVASWIDVRDGQNYVGIHFKTKTIEMWTRFSSFVKLWCCVIILIMLNKTDERGKL